MKLTQERLREQLKKPVLSSGQFFWLFIRIILGTYSNAGTPARDSDPGSLVLGTSQIHFERNLLIL